MMMSDRDEWRTEIDRLKIQLEEEKNTSATWENILNGERENHSRALESNRRLRADIAYAIGKLDMARERFEDIEAMADQWSQPQAHIARLAIDALPDLRGPVTVIPHDMTEAAVAARVQQFLNWRLAEVDRDKLLAIALIISVAETPGVAKDAEFAVKRIGHVLRGAGGDSNRLMGIAAEVNAVGNAGKDPKAAIEAIGELLGEPF